MPNDLKSLSKEELILKLESLKSQKKSLVKSITNIETEIGYILVLLQNNKND